MELVLVRHGQTAANRSGALDTGRPGCALDEKGLAQARHLAARWEAEVAPLPQVVAVSPLRRTRQTAAPLLERCGVRPLVRRGIREIRSGDVEMDSWTSSIARYMETLDRWAHRDVAVRMEGAESGIEVLGRALPVVAEVVRVARETVGEDGVAALVVHGALLRFLAPTLSDDLDPTVVMAHRPANTSTTVLDLPASCVPDVAGTQLVGAFRARTWNDRPVGEWASAVGDAPDLVNAED